MTIPRATGADVPDVPAAGTKPARSKPARVNVKEAPNAKPRGARRDAPTDERPDARSLAGITCVTGITCMTGITCKPWVTCAMLRRAPWGASRCVVGDRFHMTRVNLRGALRCVKQYNAIDEPEARLRHTCFLREFEETDPWSAPLHEKTR